MSNLLELVDRMAGVNADGRLPRSRLAFYVFRTADAALCRCHPDLSADLRQSLEHIALAERGRQRDWPRDYARYLRLLAGAGTVQAVRSGPLYSVMHPPEGAATQITQANAELLRGGLDEWLPDVEAGRLIYAAIADGRAVSICASVVAVEGAHAAGVETLPSHRRLGLAAQAVSAWADAVLRTGATPFYGTSFDNLASQGVARRLNMELVGVEFSVECELAAAANRAPSHPVEFRPVTAEDFPMLWRWRQQPHVREFYQRDEISPDELAAKLGPRVRGEVPTICHVALHRGEPFAYLQCYRNADWPEYAELSGALDGICVDLHIGEPALLHRGFGQSMLRAYLRDVAFQAFDEETAYIAHDVSNASALRCSIAVGFQPIGEFVEDGFPMRLLKLSRAAIMEGQAERMD